MSRNLTVLAAARFATLRFVLPVLAFVLFVAPFVSAQVVKVEEDWEMVLLDPDADTVAPQVTTVMCPTANMNCFHAAFELNHQTQPDFRPGGLQVQFWSGEAALANRKFPNEQKLSTAGETVRWTQRLSVGGGSITFEIDGGTSETWGSFGGQEYLKDTYQKSFDNLNAYSPTVSVEQSGIGYAANRVSRLVLKEVRYYSSAGLIETDTTDRVVHEHQ
jgi:hypothetical protein